jgi:hypothetical protein
VLYGVNGSQLLKQFIGYSAQSINSLFLCRPNALHHIHKSLLYTIVSSFNPVHILTAYFSKSAVYFIQIPLYSYTTVHTPDTAFEVYTGNSLQHDTGIEQNNGNTTGTIHIFFITMVLDHLLPSVQMQSFLEWTPTCFEQSLRLEHLHVVLGGGNLFL